MQSFDATGPLVRLKQERRRVLITGAAGHIGSYVAEQGHDRYDFRLMVEDQHQAQRLHGFGEVVVGNLDDLDHLKQFCTGIDTVLHLAANADPSTPWNNILQNNIIGTYNLFVAAKSAGCRRVIFASSIHAISGYPRDVQVKSNEPVNPGDIYGVSKCFGEALARYMAEQEGLSAVAIRIGAFQPPEAMQSSQGIDMLDAWVSPRDLLQLFERCIEAENLRFAIFAGLSNNPFKRMDIADARTLVGYQPQDDISATNPALRPFHLSQRLPDHDESDANEKPGIRQQVPGTG